MLSGTKSRVSTEFDWFGFFTEENTGYSKSNQSFQRPKFNNEIVAFAENQIFARQFSLLQIDQIKIWVVLEPWDLIKLKLWTYLQILTKLLKQFLRGLCPEHNEHNQHNDL